MTYFKPVRKHPLALAAMILVAAALAGCSGGDKPKKSSQTLASVNGEEITVLQLNEELQRANIQAAQQEAAGKQLLEVLIDRQLLQNEAAKDKTDRDPKVVQAIERAKALIVAQAYMQKRVGTVDRPTRADVEQYYTQHPEFFSKRKQFDMRQLVIASKDLDAAAKTGIDAAKALDDVAAWFDANNVKYTRAQISRSTSDLAPELSAKLQSLKPGQIFIVKEGERSMVISIADIREAPVTLEVAAGQIEQFLFNKKNKAAADAELARLRAAAKIEYMNKPDAAATKQQAAAQAPAAATAPVANAANERGVAGLK